MTNKRYTSSLIIFSDISIQTRFWRSEKVVEILAFVELLLYPPPKILFELKNRGRDENFLIFIMKSSIRWHR